MFFFLHGWSKSKIVGQDSPLSMHLSLRLALSFALVLPSLCGAMSIKKWTQKLRVPNYWWKALKSETGLIFKSLRAKSASFLCAKQCGDVVKCAGYYLQDGLCNLGYVHFWYEGVKKSQLLAADFELMDFYHEGREYFLLRSYNFQYLQI